MPTLPLIVRPLGITQRKGQPDEITFPDGILPLTTPLATPPMSQVRLFRLLCNFRVQPVPGVWEAIIDPARLLPAG